MSATWPPHLGKKLDYPEVAVGAILAGSARRFGDRVAFRHHDEELSYAELWRRACQFANGLVARRVKPGDRVALRMPNCLPFPVAYYGLLLAGATFVPVNPLLPEPAVEAVLKDSDAVLTVTPGEVASICEGQPETQPEVEIDIHSHLAHLAYTGGTTGLSKGVRLPHRNVVINTLQFACWQTGSVPALDAEGGLYLDQSGASPEEYRARVGEGKGINLTPWFHAMGTIAGLNVLLLVGFTATLHDRFDPVAYLADAEKLQVNYMGGAPALFAGLLACPDIHTRDLTSVLAIGSGAAPMPLEMTNALQKIMPNAVISEGYGLTEVTMGATGSPTFASGLRKVGTVGVPVFDTEVKIVPLDGGDPLPAGEPGEVCIRGPQIMLGYHNRPEETAEAIVDGWLHTGDIGILDEDGYLSIVDRKKDMLLYKGYNVYPRELEELLIAHPAVAMAAVVGRKDTEVGELPVAFVIPAKPDASAEQIMADINDQVVPYKRLREVILTDQIPISAAGKILKRELRDRLTS
ncbi:long-chain acyl-CoA synthetase [Kibdelosporangium banguiense]|uniref:Long-chain acyl-CoA synthetase n=1 Tax=Kibdelosporangium banguiense TaxID=1365924 RepID=A0ABS4TFR8_9PSEU|nr:AMP-binding protein [Kibdelosporangium banguiense]MBP2322824.1 long-chain acyl-CoA synthetase [Kibdelosporangium banguiense]